MIFLFHTVTSAWASPEFQTVPRIPNTLLFDRSTFRTPSAPALLALPFRRPAALSRAHQHGRARDKTSCRQGGRDARSEPWEARSRAPLRKGKAWTTVDARVRPPRGSSMGSRLRPSRAPSELREREREDGSTRARAAKRTAIRPSSKVADERLVVAFHFLAPVRRRPSRAR
jgi:hypothetical protein